MLLRARLRRFLRLEASLHDIRIQGFSYDHHRRIMWPFSKVKNGSFHPHTVPR
jgi:hypothetical protein